MKTQKHISKFMSLVLRHQPEIIDLKLNANGWANLEELIQKMNQKGKKVNLEIIQEVVASNDKKRFIISEDGLKIRANQGHSISIDLDLKPTDPPSILYHGTATRFLKSILETGLEKRNRQHVHLSKDLATATQVGKRHGKLVILKVLSKEMQTDGFTFYQSENAVWLTDHVPTKYIEVVEK